MIGTARRATLKKSPKVTIVFGPGALCILSIKLIQAISCYRIIDLSYQSLLQWPTTGTHKLEKAAGTTRSRRERLNPWRALRPKQTRVGQQSPTRCL